jgi:hypothetical protein
MTRDVTLYMIRLDDDAATYSSSKAGPTRISIEMEVSQAAFPTLKFPEQLNVTIHFPEE